MFHIHTNHVLTKMTVDLVKQMEGVHDCVYMGKYIIFVHIGSLFDTKKVLDKVCEHLDHWGSHGYQEDINASNLKLQEELKKWNNEGTIISVPGLTQQFGVHFDSHEPADRNYAVYGADGHHFADNEAPPNGAQIGPTGQGTGWIN